MRSPLSFLAPLLLSACTGTSPDPPAADADTEASPDSSADSPPPDTSPPDCTVAPDPLDPPVPPLPPASTDYLVISADPLLPVAEDLAAWRRTRGHTVEVLPMSTVARLTDGTPDLAHYPDRIRAAVAARRDALDPALPLLVLLFGDADESWDGDSDVVPSATWLDPGHWVDEITSDNLYADLDGDNLPDAAVGRVPVRTVDEARRYLEAVQDYDTRYEPGPWNRTIHVFASEGGFGDLLDDILLDVGMRVIGEVPPEWSVTFTYAARSSPYTYPPTSFSDRIYRYLNDGGFLMAYIGHGSPSGFTDADWDGGPSGPIFDTSRLAEIDIEHRPPLLVFIACSTGSFDTDDSISERILRQPGSSPAILSSTETSHPYSNTIFVREIERVAMFERPRTLGDLFLRAKRAMVERDDDLRDFMDNLAALQLTPEELANLPAAHLHMYTLLGDPGLELPFPRGTVDVTVQDDRLPPGDVVRFCAQVHGPPAGTAHVTFEIERTELARPSQPWSLDDAGWEETVVANHESANDKAVWSADVPYEGGGFGLSFVIPPETRRYDHHLVVYAEDGAVDALGQALVRVRLE
ncbi:MAG: hypothetical protein HY905_03640 [Deltaproteobacteria bacterium]|nr:hypothetical protein [Deltaproteobacteria bacterium]